MLRVSLTDAQVRRWLVNFHSTDRLSDWVMRDVLLADGRAWDGSPSATAREARALLQEKIEALAPPPEAPRRAWRPFFVLVVCFVHATDAETAAARLGFSTRQLTRERGHAISLLRAELEMPGKVRTWLPT